MSYYLLTEPLDMRVSVPGWGEVLARPMTTALSRKRSHGGVAIVPARSAARSDRRRHLHPKGRLVGMTVMFSCRHMTQSGATEE